MTGFFMKGNTGLKQVEQVEFSLGKRKFFINPFVFRLNNY